MNGAANASDENIIPARTVFMDGSNIFIFMVRGGSARVRLFYLSFAWDGKRQRHQCCPLPSVSESFEFQRLPDLLSFLDIAIGIFV
jgi:hypothetical protein